MGDALGTTLISVASNRSQDDGVLIVSRRLHVGDRAATCLELTTRQAVPGMDGIHAALVGVNVAPVRSYSVATIQDLKERCARP